MKSGPAEKRAGQPGGGGKQASGPAQRSAVAGLASVFRANVPQVYLDVDRTDCMLKGVDLQDVFMTLQVYLGSLYVNDFNRFGRTWQVIAQAEAKYRDQKDDISRLQVRNTSGNDGARWAPWPRSARSTGRWCSPGTTCTRRRRSTAAPARASARAAPSTSCRAWPSDELPKSMGYEWTEMAYLELQAGNTAMIVFGFSIVMVFLVLAAQFESWSMPLAVILSVPLCMLERLYRGDQRHL